MEDLRFTPNAGARPPGQAGASPSAEQHCQRLETLGRLASGVAHDLNNLLTVIAGYGHFLVDELDPAGPHSDAARQICGAVERCSRLTGHLLAFSRPQPPVDRVLNLNTIVTEMSHMLRRLIPENVHLVLQLEPQLGLIKADAGQIEQVILNLVVNARDAIAKEGLVHIETANAEREGAPMVLLLVSDTGHGMAPETQARIFEPFFSTKDPAHGTGLGLATVRRIIEDSGGSITVESEAGRGTTFRVYLPQCEDPSRRLSAGAASAVPRTVETVLVVEDETSVRELITGMLHREGYRVIPAGDAETALRLSELETGPIDLLVTDVILPGMPGTDLAAVLRSRRPRIAVLLVSGYALDDQGSEVCFLAKPFTPEELMRKARLALSAAGRTV